MDSLGIAYQEVLGPRQRQALAQALSVLLDSWFTDLAGLAQGEGIEDTLLIDALPRRYVPRYNQTFARRFLLCLATVGWKLAQPERYPLQCVGEELAALALIDEAKSCLEIEEEADGEEDASPDVEALDALVDLLFEDTDVLYLFHEEFDGIDLSDLGASMGMESLDFSAWFEAFTSSPEDGLHPYYAARARKNELEMQSQVTSSLGAAYRHLLTDQEQEALTASIPLLLDEWFDALATEEAGKSFVGTNLAATVPPAYQPFITPVVAKSLLLCLSTVAWKLAQPQPYSLSSIAEQLAARALLRRAETWLKASRGGEQAGPHQQVKPERLQEDLFAAFDNLLFRDEGVQYLFAEQPEAPHKLAAESQSIHEALPQEMVQWFEPFSTQEGEPVSQGHPYRPGR
jgi:hypothetical protein